ncbi:hypothetical protein ACFY8F_32690 [Streptomyces tanashiensis]|uniref:hypothetical protein n=1 Tax=Streptomyces tanashiensis TaxID=67367 RepID=UPI00369C8085
MQYDTAGRSRRDTGAPSLRGVVAWPQGSGRRALRNRRILPVIPHKEERRTLRLISILVTVGVMVAMLIAATNGVSVTIG